MGHGPRRHPSAHLAGLAEGPVRRWSRLPVRVRLLRAQHRPALLVRAPQPARPRVRVRHRPRAWRRRDGSPLVRGRQAPPQAQHLHRFHRRRRVPRRHRADDAGRSGGPRWQRRRAAHGRRRQHAARPVRGDGGRGAIRRRPDDDPRRVTATDRHRMGGVGQPGGLGRGVRLHEVVLPVRQRRGQALPGAPCTRRPERSARRLLGTGQMGCQAAGPEDRRQHPSAQD